MRAFGAILLTLALGACAAQPAEVVTAEPESGAGAPGAGLPGPGQSPCPDPRPQVCTMEYRPTCAVMRDGGRRQYSSPCNACADDSVAATLSGPCPG